MRAARLESPSQITLIQVIWDASPDLEEFLRFIRAYAKGRFSSNLAERIALASNELLDNAVRYGSLARDFSYRLDLDSSLVKVRVHNTTVMARIEMLTSQVRRLASSPEQVYASELERSTSTGGRRSMLGLARIRHEAEMQLDLNLEGLDVSVCASCAR
jgi:hypothetical protein